MAQAPDGASPPRPLPLSAGRGRRRPGAFPPLGLVAVGPVHAVAQLLAGAEEDAALGLHRNHLSGLGVAPLVAVVVLHVEGAQAADLDVLALAERALHRVEDRLDGELGLLLRHAALHDQDVDEVRLEHGNSALAGWWPSNERE